MKNKNIILVYSPPWDQPAQMSSINLLDFGQWLIVFYI